MNAICPHYIDGEYHLFSQSSLVNGEPSNSLKQVLYSGGTQVFTGHPTFSSLHSEGTVTARRCIHRLGHSCTVFPSISYL